MENIPPQNIQHSIIGMVKKYGLEGTYELIEAMIDDKGKNRLLMEFHIIYKLNIKGQYNDLY